MLMSGLVKIETQKLLKYYFFPVGRKVFKYFFFGMLMSGVVKIELYFETCLNIIFWCSDRLVAKSATDKICTNIIFFVLSRVYFACRRCNCKKIALILFFSYLTEITLFVAGGLVATFSNFEICLNTFFC